VPHLEKTIAGAWVYRICAALLTLRELVFARIV
jgi:hypothetical protein